MILQSPGQSQTPVIILNSRFIAKFPFDITPFTCNEPRSNENAIALNRNPSVMAYNNFCGKIMLASRVDLPAGDR
jgi:hypothetical protein